MHHTAHILYGYIGPALAHTCAKIQMTTTSISHFTTIFAKVEMQTTLHTCHICLIFLGIYRWMCHLWSHWHHPCDLFWTSYHVLGISLKECGYHTADVSHIALILYGHINAAVLHKSATTQPTTTFTSHPIGMCVPETHIIAKLHIYSIHSQNIWWAYIGDYVYLCAIYVVPHAFVLTAVDCLFHYFLYLPICMPN